MMGSRCDTIGIKQVIRLEWMQTTAQLFLAGLDTKTVRQELHSLLADSRGSGADEERSDQTRTFVVNILMRIWGSQDDRLKPLRDMALEVLRERPEMAVATHWAMISATYPFWFQVAKQTGRLLGLQEQVTRQQIISRLKEQYGDRQTVSRYARYVLRSFVVWGVLRDSNVKGCYEKGDPVHIDDPGLVAFMYETALHNYPDGRAALCSLQHEPALFPFSLPVISESSLHRVKRIEVLRYGLDDVYLELMRKSLHTDASWV